MDSACKDLMPRFPLSCVVLKGNLRPRVCPKEVPHVDPEAIPRQRTWCGRVGKNTLVAAVSSVNSLHGAIAKCRSRVGVKARVYIVARPHITAARGGGLAHHDQDRASRQ